eukprot:Clim_evm50s231 gene=Clim_evmTU50s231
MVAETNQTYLHEQVPAQVVVVGLGMSALKCLDRLTENKAVARLAEITVIGEEIHPCYNRVGLTNYFTHFSNEKMYMVQESWYQERNITLQLNSWVRSINRENRTVEYLDAAGNTVHKSYDYLLLATGSISFIPPVKTDCGIDKDHLLDIEGVFAYRGLDDVAKMVDYAVKSTTKSAIVIGGGLLGLEAAKALKDMNLRTTVIERNPHILARQVDEAAGRLIAEQVGSLGVHVQCRTGIRQMLTEKGEAEDSPKMSGVQLGDGLILDAQMMVFAAGILPRDDLASCGLEKEHNRRGFKVNDHMLTSDDRIYAIGECATHRGVNYGLIAPCYRMAETAMQHLCTRLLEGLQVASRDVTPYAGSDMSTKLKLLGVHVASVADYFADQRNEGIAMTFVDPFSRTYKKLIFDLDGHRLLGAILVGDTNDYGKLLQLATKSTKEWESPNELILGVSKEEGGDALADDTQVCSCNNVTKKNICDAIRNNKLTAIGEVKSCTKAGTSCGGCMPLVNDIFSKELAKAGGKISKAVCTHFKESRAELFSIIQVMNYQSLEEVMKSRGTNPDAEGCEECKPMLASIFASLHNKHILKSKRAALQDTNDRFLANIQRDATYSVVPRIPGGEITPQQLTVLGEVAKKYGLYTKITGGQRVDLFGAPVHKLPDIWADLVKEGFESGHAYGKSLRTVKSCVGSTWCRYGLRDSVGMAVNVEERYKGLRAPHKLKGAVSGCVRECAEAQSKDFGMIATEKGYNVYVCGNGGSKPRHADLLVADVSEEDAIKYLDRFLMFYVRTADRLQRTARWLESLDGGLDYLKAVVVDDSLGIAEELERQMEAHVGSYKCEWKEVVEDPELIAEFKQFINTDETEKPTIEPIDQRGQKRPADWPKNHKVGQLGVKKADGAANPEENSIKAIMEQWRVDNVLSWKTVGHIFDVQNSLGRSFRYGKSQLAVFFHAKTETFYVTQNMCPHKRAFVLSRGIIGDVDEQTPKVACPLHKKTFNLKTGDSISDPDDYEIFAFKARGNRDGTIEALLPPTDLLDTFLATERHVIRKNDETGISYIASPPPGKACGTGGGGCGGSAMEW